MYFLHLITAINLDDFHLLLPHQQRQTRFCSCSVLQTAVTHTCLADHFQLHTVAVRRQQCSLCVKRVKGQNSARLYSCGTWLPML